MQNRLIGRYVYSESYITLLDIYYNLVIVFLHSILLAVFYSIASVIFSTKDVNPPHRHTKIAEFIKTSCDPKLCVSLSSYARSVKRTLSKMAKVTAYVSLVHVCNASVWASGMITRSANLSKGERATLGNSIENFQDIADELCGSLAGLNLDQQ
jgi:hypothetical protein